MKSFFLSIVMVTFSSIAFSQKNKVDASIDLVTKTQDSISLGKGKNIVVMLPVKNRAGDDWKLSPVPSKLKFTQSYLGQAGMLPNQEEPKLFFFKATAAGTDSIRFQYLNPKAPAGEAPEYRVLYVNIQ
ncbi:MAG: protease inhibitor I42 family protein [Chitinophagaceae bacterium]|nr:protease inhibitor I42 family protein [Chitinophagaceae bacterium]